MSTGNFPERFVIWTTETLLSRIPVKAWRDDLVVKKHNDFPEDPGSIPSTEMGVCNISNYSTMGFNTLIWPLWVLDMHKCTDTHQRNITCKITKKWLIKVLKDSNLQLSLDTLAISPRDTNYASFLVDFQKAKAVFWGG